VQARNLVGEGELEETREPEVLLNEVFPSCVGFTELCHEEVVESILVHHERALEASRASDIRSAISRLGQQEDVSVHAVKILLSS